MLEKSIICLGLVIMMFALLSTSALAEDKFVVIEEKATADSIVLPDFKELVAYQEAEDKLKGVIVGRVSQHVAKFGTDVMVVSMGTIMNWHLMEEYLLRSYDNRTHEASIKLKVPEDVFEEFVYDNVLPVNMPVFIITDENGAGFQIGQECPDIIELQKRTGQGSE